MATQTTRAVAGAVGLLAGALLMGCDSSNGPGKSSSVGDPTPSSPLTVDSKASAKAKALKAYRGMWRAYVAATRKANPDHPDLARHASGEALRTFQKGLRQLRDEGLRGRGDVKLHPVVDKIEPASAPTAAYVSDCVDTSKSSLYKANGDPYKDTPGGKQSMSATVKRVGSGTWKVTSFGLREVGSCK